MLRELTPRQILHDYPLLPLLNVVDVVDAAAAVVVVVREAKVAGQVSC